MLNQAKKIFTDAKLTDLFPKNRADSFFEALFGDAEEGAYDITLHLAEQQSEAEKLFFELHLHQRPGKCLACNLTYGLPEVFSRHPIININGLVKAIAEELNCGELSWEFGHTQQISNQLHVIPLIISTPT